MKGFFQRSLLWLPVLLAVLLTGCATSSSKIWEARVGNYTYDQAVVELGPPDKQAKLENGTLVADWLTHHGYTYTEVTPEFISPYPYYSSPHYPIITQGYSPDYFLRLVFTPDGKLQTWKRYAR